MSGQKIRFVLCFPNKLSFIFYAEYGAHADREYLSLTDGGKIVKIMQYSYIFTTLALHFPGPLVIINALVWEHKL